MEIAVLALGCFWGPEDKFSKINGIIKTEVGYCGGNNSNTSYKEVCSGSTNHAKLVYVLFRAASYSCEFGFLVLRHRANSLGQICNTYCIHMLQL